MRENILKERRHCTENSWRKKFSVEGYLSTENFFEEELEDETKPYNI